MGNDDAVIEILSSSEVNVRMELGRVLLTKPLDMKFRNFSDGKEAK
jgi:hypothetical protein